MSTIAKKYKNLNEIPSANYEGYIWMSDEQSPKVLNCEKFEFGSVKTNPFIVEGLLFDKTNGISIHIQHTGEYRISEYHLNEIKSEKFIEQKEYLPHRLIKDVKKVCFKQIWEEIEDQNCQRFPVLTLAAIVFCGFKK